ncbi:unnamed protein product [Effrenium voratum]|uniref:Uncharacterized protein n=1 Tax=Effrenium voratum TaxID=2562239 RepID=A0AA36IV78_9DINO|nr:unnamed protein product [Effrenium voratum]
MASSSAASASASVASARPAPRVLQIPGRPLASQKRRFMSDKVGEIRSKPSAPKAKAKAGRSDPEERDTADFKRTLKDVLNFVMPQLGRAERKQYENAKVKALGGTLEKPPWEPYSVLQRRRKGEEAARQRRLAEEQTLGVSMSATQQRKSRGQVSAQRKKQAEVARKRRPKEPDILNLGEGARERRGMVVLPKKRVRAYA